MNNILILFEMMLTIFFITIFFKKKNHEGLYLYTILAYIISIIISIKNIEVMTIELPLGIILTTSIYLVSNILVQDKGIEAINKLSKILLITMMCIIPVLLLTSTTTTDIATIPNTYSELFISKFRIVLITAFMPFAIIRINSYLYYELKREKNNILLNSILTILIVFFIDATIYSLLSFIFIQPINKIFITTAVIYVLKIVMGIITIPILYKMQKSKK